MKETGNVHLRHVHSLLSDLYLHVLGHDLWDLTAPSTPTTQLLAQQFYLSAKPTARDGRHI